jgi:hypothetical protein
MKAIIIFLIILTYFHEASGQQSGPLVRNKIDSDIAIALDYYRHLMNTNYDLINGKEYIVYHKINHSNPFYKSSTLASGCVYANDRTFCDFKLIYDIYKDELVVNFLNTSGYLKLASLNQHFVDSFDISINNITSRFLNLKFRPEDHMKNGYYEIKHRGKTLLLIRHIKIATQVNSQDDYPESETKYLFINGQFQKISSLRKFCRLFGEQHTMMKKFIKSIQIYNFRKITDEELVTVLAYYDKTTKP